MKILFVGDYSNFHVTLARELRRRGHDVTVASSGSGCMDVRRDIDLTRRKGMLGAFAYLGRLMRFMENAKGYDVVQIVNPGFFALKPGKLRYFFNELKRNNASIFLSVAGDDPVIMKGNCEDHLLPYSEMRIGREKTSFAKSHPYYEQHWMSGSNGDYCRHVYESVNGAMSALYEYDVLARPYLGDRLAYTGIPVDTRSLSPGDDYDGIKLGKNERVNIVVAVKSEYEAFKGLDRLYKVFTRLEALHPDKVKVTRVEDLPYEEYLKAVESAHVIVDQLYSMTPATNALETMARGKVTVSGGEDCFYRFLGEDASTSPIVNLSPLDSDEDMIHKLEATILDNNELQRLSSMGPEWVARHNDVRIVADKFLEHWDKLR